MSHDKWHKRYINLAEYVAQWSKDPSTKTGAVLVRPDNTVVSIGFNGFPRGIEDKADLLYNREEKYKRVIHCEMNAILNSVEKLDGYTLYVWPCQSCERCAVHVIQAGITRVVSPYDVPVDMKSRWQESWDVSEELFAEAGVEILHV